MHRPTLPRRPRGTGHGADTSPYFAYETVKVAEGIYAFVPPEPRGGLVSGNSIAVNGDDGVLVVDTGHFPTLARKMIADIRRLTDKPVRYVVNTHWHPDHVFGNGAYREAFPDVNVLAHVETRRLMVKDDPLRPSLCGGGRKETLQRADVLEVARAKVDLGAFETKLAGSTPARRLSFEVDFVQPGMERAFQEAQGKLEDE